MYEYTLHVGRDREREIDFIAQRDGERVYIQVATTLLDTKTREREYGNLQDIKDNYPKIVVTLDPQEGISYQGIKQIPIRKFLLENI